MINDARTPTKSSCRLSLGFDPVTNPHKMTPLRDSEDGDVGSATSKKQNFELALRTGTTWSLYALGVVLDTGFAEILYKDLTTGGSNDLDDAAWSTPPNNSSPTGATKFDLFTYYHKTGLIYGARNNIFWSFSPAGAAFNNTETSIVHTTVAEGLVHSKDDILYVPYDNKIAKNDNGTWTKIALTLPDHLVITSICEYGNYLAIATAPLSNIGNSVTYLWNRNDSLTTLSEKIDWGGGVIRVLEELEGFLIGISFEGITSTNMEDRIRFSSYSESLGAIKFEEFVCATGTQLPNVKQRTNKKIYFMMSTEINGTMREGVFSISRSDASSRFAVTQEMPAKNDTALVSGVIRNFHVLGDFFFQAFVNNAVHEVTKTVATDTYTTNARRETLINPGMVEGDRTQRKQLTGVRLSYSKPLVSGESAILKYKVDGGSEKTIFTDTTVDNIFFEDKTDENKKVFDPGIEYEFTIESTGGLEPVELVYEYDILKTQVS